MNANIDLYLFFARLLKYPESLPFSYSEKIRENIQNLSEEASSLVEEFLNWSQSHPLSRVQEVYTHTFDLQVIAYPYAGYHLFGESYHRGVFMATLKIHFRERGFQSDAKELPDYLPNLLQYLAHLEEMEDKLEWEVLLEDCLIPALQKMEEAFGLGKKGKEKSSSFAQKRFMPMGGDFADKKEKEDLPNLGGMEKSKNPYGKLIQAISLVLEALLQKEKLSRQFCI